MLESAKAGILKTQIMYRANLSYTQLNNYLTFLLHYGLIIHSTVDGKEGYLITAKGLDFIQRHRELERMIGINTDKKPNFTLNSF
jgi:predicted transcriptional regulator